ncbi:MAG: epimerase [Chthoniobacterales bacterium]|nr:MAG: epimerase [Chthoniobacterales bacterium]
MHPGRIILIGWVIYALLLAVALARRAPRAKKKIPRQLSGPLRLLVIGATGGSGRELVEQALKLGHQVTALVRTPAKLTIQHPNLRVVRGDVLDYTSVESAMESQDAVLCALGHKKFFGPSSILSEGTRNLLRAMQSRPVPPRFICESSLGVGSAAGRLGLPALLVFVPLVLPFYFWDRVRQEKLIEGSDLDWVIVRPSVLTDGPERGAYRHGPNVGSYILPTKISRADVANFMLKQLHDDTYVGAAPGLCY